MMRLTQSQKNKIARRVDEVANEADSKYGTSVSARLDLRFDLRGKTAGQAFCDGRLRLNEEACAKHFDEMLEDTIPHEVAHLVCFQNRCLGRNHDAGWRLICKELGGSGDRCHSFQLTPARKTTKFKYSLDDGTEVTVGKIRHNKIQRGYIYWMNPQACYSGKKQYIKPHHFEEKV